MAETVTVLLGWKKQQLLNTVFSNLKQPVQHLVHQNEPKTHMNDKKSTDQSRFTDLTWLPEEQLALKLSPQCLMNIFQKKVLLFPPPVFVLVFSFEQPNPPASTFSFEAALAKSAPSQFLSQFGITHCSGNLYNLYFEPP